jgi:hypothetical protein
MIINRGNFRAGVRMVNYRGPLTPILTLALSLKEREVFVCSDLVEMIWKR